MKCNFLGINVGFNCRKARFCTAEYRLDRGQDLDPQSEPERELEPKLF
jgi:hypothetical protein